MRRLKLVFAIVAALLASGPAFAQVQSVGDIGPGTASIFGNGGTRQSLTAPASATVMTEVRLGMAHFPGDGPQTYTVSIHRDIGGTPGPAVETSATFTTTTIMSNYAVQSFILSAPLPVTPGERLHIQVDAPPNTALWASVSPSYYAGGNLFDVGAERPNIDAYFVALFDAPTPVPTLPEWALMILATILAGSAAAMLQGRRFVRS